MIYIDEGEFKTKVLKNIPTKLLLKNWLIQRPVKIKNMFRIKSWRDFPNVIDYGNGDVIDYRIQIIIPKFAYWNPKKGNSYKCYFPPFEVKDELNTREHIKRKGK